MSFKYDETDKSSIESYARELLDKRLIDVSTSKKSDKLNNVKSKGNLGQAIEEEYFGYKVNSRQEADFNKVGVELKVCPIKKIRKKENSNFIRERLGFSAKERIVLSIIDFMKLNEEEWENNSLMKKCKELLLMFYIHEKDVPKDELTFKIINLWTPSENDMKIIEQDWRIIQKKVKEGRAHEISEGDTMYLGACTKGSTAEKSKRKQPNSDILAPQRAFSYKRGYVDYIIEELLQLESKKKKKQVKLLAEENRTFDEVIFNVFNELLQLSVKDIKDRFEIHRERKAKNYLRLIVDDVCKKTFGDKLEEFEEFKKAGIEIKVILVKPDGMPKESMSFEQINYCEIVNEEWDNSTIKEKFENKKHLWIIFKSKRSFDKQGELGLDEIYLDKVMFWNMPIDDLNNSMYRVWRDTTEKIRNGIYDNFIKISDGEIAHIRPKARNSKDLMITPQGDYQLRKCFWLNARYIKEQIQK